ncbi:FAD binding domain-containing protein [Chloroflexi bacterium TSY]|nr:FAD binding domain-containing protein [Chloroflexi bacterium TSY]
MWSIYLTPQSIDEALHLLAEYGDRARLVAGGTDLMVELERGIWPSSTLIDVTQIAGLDQIELDAQGLIRLGPLVTHNQVVASSLCVARAFPLVKACWEVGAPQIRNRGTIAGNLATASPANDTITPLWTLDATVTLQSLRGQRTLTFDEFFLGARKTALAVDEMIVDIAFPALKSDERGTFLKLGLRRAQAISIVNVAVILERDVDIVQNARIALGSVAPTIVRMADAEDYLVGKVLTADVMVEAGRLAARAIHPISDVRGSAAYRLYMTETLTRQALQALAHGTERQSVPDNPILLWGETDGRISTSHDASQAATETIIHTEDGEKAIETIINGSPQTICGANDKSLLRMLRENVNLIGTKEGCAEGECGACTVFLDGIAIMSCLTPAPQAHGRSVTTIEGVGGEAKETAEAEEEGSVAVLASLGETGDREVEAKADAEEEQGLSNQPLHPVQRSFIDAGAVQCGYCTPGFIMSGVSLLAERERPTHDEVKQAITGNLCRCTGYYKIVEAIERAGGGTEAKAEEEG